MKTKIIIPTGEVVGIGKLKVFTTKSFKFIIPTLSFIVARDGDCYIASCLHLLLDASAKNINDAVDRLCKVCEDFMISIFENNESDAWDQLHELFTSHCLTEFWDAYRDVQLNLSEKGINTDGTFINSLTSKIEEKNKEIEKLKEELAVFNQSDDKKNDPIQISVVSFQEVMAA